MTVFLLTTTHSHLHKTLEPHLPATLTWTHPTIKLTSALEGWESPHHPWLLPSFHWFPSQLSVMQTWNCRHFFSPQFFTYGARSISHWTTVREWCHQCCRLATCTAVRGKPPIPLPPSSSSYCPISALRLKCIG